MTGIQMGSRKLGKTNKTVLCPSRVLDDGDYFFRFLCNTSLEPSERRAESSLKLQPENRSHHPRGPTHPSSRSIHVAWVHRLHSAPGRRGQVFILRDPQGIPLRRMGPITYRQNTELQGAAALEPRRN